jgi:small subunit ribosomal protein S14
MEVFLAKQCLIEKAKRKPKFAVRAYTRCNVCGRSRGVFRRFGICRICFREMAHKGLIPGVTKSSW